MKYFIDKRGQNCWLQIFVPPTSRTELNPDQGYQNQPARRIAELKPIDPHAETIEVYLGFTQFNTDILLCSANSETDVLSGHHVEILSPQIQNNEALPAGQIHSTVLTLLVSKRGWNQHEIFEENHDRYRIYCAVNGYPIPPRHLHL